MKRRRGRKREGGRPVVSVFTHSLSSGGSILFVLSSNDKRQEGENKGWKSRKRSDEPSSKAGLSDSRVIFF